MNNSKLNLVIIAISLIISMYIIADSNPAITGKAIGDDDSYSLQDLSATNKNISLAANGSWYGSAINNYLGYNPASGDFNGDGYDDMVIAANNNSDNAARTGKIYLIYGGSNIALRTNISLAANASWYGESTDDIVGFDQMTMGDVNGDGYDDIIISVSSAASGNGKIYLIYGCSNNCWGLNNNLSTSNASWIGAEFDLLESVSSGDVNGDEYDDILVGGEGYPLGDGDGIAYLIYGFSNGDFGKNLDISVKSNASFIMPAAETGNADGLGASVDIMGDFNADGYDDMLISAPYYYYTYSAETGISYLVEGCANCHSTQTADISAKANASWIGEAPGDYMGYTTNSRTGDINGDGYDDILNVAIKNNAAGNHAGKVYVAYGCPNECWGQNTNISKSNVSWIGERANELLGSYISGGADVNGDGYQDIITSGNNAIDTSGKVYVFYGSSNLAGSKIYANKSNLSYTGERATDLLHIGSNGDINKDGASDILSVSTLNNYGGNRAGQAYIVYGIDTTSPAITNQINYTNDNATYIYSAKSNEKGACTLWGNWSGLWAPNETKTVLANTRFNFTALQFTTYSNYYAWTINCSDLSGNIAWGANYTSLVGRDIYAPRSTTNLSIVTGIALNVANLNWESVSLDSSGNPDDSELKYVIWRSTTNPANYSDTPARLGFDNLKNITGAISTNDEISITNTYYYIITTADDGGNSNLSVKNETNAKNIGQIYLQYTAPTHDTSSGTSSGGSGGSSYGGSNVEITNSLIINGMKQSEVWDTITAEKPISILITKSDFAIKQIDVSVKETISNAGVTVTQLIEQPATTTELDHAYKYFNIEGSNIGTSLDKAKIKFSVEKSWLAVNGLNPNSVVMHKFKGAEWMPLTTFKISEDDKYAQYEAETTTFSYYAISAKPLIKINEMQINPETAGNEIENISESEEIPQQALQELPSSPFKITEIFIVGIILIIVTILFLKRIKYTPKANAKKRRK